MSEYVNSYEETLFRTGIEVENTTHRFKIEACISENDLTKQFIKDLRSDFEIALCELVKAIAKRYPLEEE